MSLGDRKENLVYLPYILLLLNMIVCIYIYQGSESLMFELTNGEILIFTTLLTGVVTIIVGLIQNHRSNSLSSKIDNRTEEMLPAVNRIKEEAVKITKIDMNQNHSIRVIESVQQDVKYLADEKRVEEKLKAESAQNEYLSYKNAAATLTSLWEENASYKEKIKQLENTKKELLQALENEKNRTRLLKHEYQKLRDEYNEIIKEHDHKIKRGRSL